jgi:hypothetical protein
LVLFQGYERRCHSQQKIGSRLKFSGDITTRCFPGPVDEMAKAIAVKGKVKKEEKTLTFATDDKTKIQKAGRDVPFADLKKDM